MLVIEFIIVVFLVLYVIFVLRFTWGWIKMPVFQTKNENLSGVSIVVVYRNEADKIVHLLHSLINLQYPVSQFEIIFVDDHSTDNTTTLIRDFFVEHNMFSVQMLQLDSQFGKKYGIECAVGHAKYELIACTDADCVVPQGWLNEFADYYQQTHCRIISAPVTLFSPQTLFGNMQQMEFGTLIAIGAGAIAVNQPVMCNGANICFEKQTYSTLLDEIRKKYHLASGDDIFLLQACKKKYGAESIGFVKSPKSIVQTYPMTTIQSFFSQRSRWGGKTKYYTDRFTQFMALCVVTVSCGIVTLLVLAVCSVVQWLVPLSVWAVKLVVDFPIIALWARFIKQKHILIYYPITAVAYPFYIVGVLILMLFKNSQWKSRSMKNKNAIFAK